MVEVRGYPEHPDPRAVGTPDALEMRARLIAAARGENPESLLITYDLELARIAEAAGIRVIAPA
ncbi:hypothetical protein [Herbiconiux sp. UC225_62]|uniref:hypothetical protein n=1 Tax=Herbiconiux sp. UC225_62 TaxID=3350168 RepID=UPI0036D3F6B7